MGPTIGNSYNGVYSGRYWFWGTQVLYYGEVKNKTFKKKLQKLISYKDIKVHIYLEWE